MKLLKFLTTLNQFSKIAAGSNSLKHLLFTFSSFHHISSTNQIEPQLKAIYGTISQALREYIDGVIDIVAHVAAIVTDFFEKHKGELQELTNTFAEIFKGR